MSLDDPEEQIILASSLMILRADMPDALCSLEHWDTWMRAVNCARHALAYVRVYPAMDKPGAIAPLMKRILDEWIRA